MADDPDLRKGQTEDLGDPGLHRVNTLGRFPDGQEVPLPAGHAAMELHGGMEFALRPIGLLQDHVGLGKPFGWFSPFVYFDRLDPVPFRVDRRGLRIKRFPLIDDEG